MWAAKLYLLQKYRVAQKRPELCVTITARALYGENFFCAVVK